MNYNCILYLFLVNSDIVIIIICTYSIEGLLVSVVTYVYIRRGFPFSGTKFICFLNIAP